MRTQTRTNEKKIMGLMRRGGVLRSKDLDPYGIARVNLQRLVQRGRIQWAGRGLYMLPEAVTEHHSLAQVCKRVPHGVVCLLSALRFHELTTQNPFEVWMAIDQKAWRPQLESPSLRIVHLSGKVLTSGVEEHPIEGVKVRVYSPAKTVVDCFKFRNRVGLDVAIEALREYRRKYPARLDELWRFARICRVERVMRPYLEALS